MFFLLSLIVVPQTQNNVYEIVSDMNQKQEVLEERIVALEERLGSIQEHLEALPEVLTKVVHMALSTQRIDASHTDQQSNARHTYLHPSDATRPACWSVGSQGGSPPAAAGTRSTFLVPANAPSGSLDT